MVQPRLEAPDTTNLSTFILPPGSAGAKSSDGIHRPHRALRHRQAGRPVLVTAAQELIPGVDDERVFHPTLCFSRERQRLIRHHAEFGNHSTRFDSKRRQIRRGLGGWFGSTGAARDKEESGSVLYLSRFDDRDQVPPNRLIRLLPANARFEKSYPARKPYNLRPAAFVALRICSLDPAQRCTCQARFVYRRRNLWSATLRAEELGALLVILSSRYSMCPLCSGPRMAREYPQS